MSNFVKGGQLAIHSVRMNLQVWKILIRFILLIIVIALGYTFYTDIKPIEWKNIGVYIKRDIAFNDNAEVEYYTDYGYKRVQKVKYAKENPILNRLGEKLETTFYKGLTIGGVTSGLVILLVLVYFFRSGKRKTASLELRGVFLIPLKKLKKEIVRHNTKFRYKPLPIIKIPYPITGSPDSYTSGEQSHTMILGSTGSGKTSVIKELLFSIHERGDKAIIVDVKGDYIKSCYRKDTDTILNPLDQRGRNWSIFKETTALTGFATIAKSLIPIDSQDPTWTDAARVVFTEMANIYANNDISLAEFADKLLKTDIGKLQQMLKSTYAEKIMNEGIEKAALSVLMILSSYLRPLKLYRSNENCFSIRDWVLSNTWNKEKRQNGFLFLASKAEAKRDLNPLITAQMDIAINAMRSLSEESNKPKIWFIIDELGYFDNPIPNLIDGLTTARSYGGCFILGMQDMTAISKIYSKERAETIVNNCRTKLFMNVEGADTARWCSENIGKGEIEEWNEGFSYGAHEMRDGISASKRRFVKNAVLEGEFALLKAGQGYIKFSGYKPARFGGRRAHIYPIAEQYIENVELNELLEQERREQVKRREELESGIYSSKKIASIIKGKGKKSKNKSNKKNNKEIVNKVPDNKPKSEPAVYSPKQNSNK